VNRHADLNRTVVAAVLLTVLALLVPIEWLSLLLLAPPAFFLSGYAMAAAAFVRNPPPWPQRAAISLGLSLAVLVLLALLLNYLGGLRPGTWALGLVIVIVVSCGVAVTRRPEGWRDTESRPRLPPVAPASAALAGAALLAVGAALVLAFVPLAATHAVGFTELWLRPYDSGAGAGVRVGVGNEEKQETAYLLRAHFGARASVETELSVDPGDTAILPLRATPPPRRGEPVFVSVALYLAEDPNHVYRRVYGWIPEPTLP
jgi:hypothetical protein